MSFTFRQVHGTYPGAGPGSRVSFALSQPMADGATVIEAVRRSMAAFSNSGPGLQTGPYVQLYETSAASVPNADGTYVQQLYIDSTTHHLMRKTSTGTVVDLG